MVDTFFVKAEDCAQNPYSRCVMVHVVESRGLGEMTNCKCETISIYDGHHRCKRCFRRFYSFEQVIKIHQRILKKNDMDVKRETIENETIRARQPEVKA